MLTTNERRILLYMTDDERHTVPDIAWGTADHGGLRNGHAADTGETRPRGFTHTPGGRQAVQFWQIFWHRAERRK